MKNTYNHLQVIYVHLELFYVLIKKMGENDRISPLVHDFKNLNPNEQEEFLKSTWLRRNILDYATNQIIKIFKRIKSWKNIVEIPPELRKSREEWKEHINNISEESKKKIIEAAEKISVKVETEPDGSRLIEFTLWKNTYQILDIKLIKTHSDFAYCGGYYGIDTVLWCWMEWDDVNQRENKKLAEYVQAKEEQWLHIAKIEEMKGILSKLWEQAKLGNEKDQIAMLMYLTWMDWWYWLSMWDDKKYFILRCCYSIRRFDNGYGCSDVSLFLIASK